MAEARDDCVSSSACCRRAMRAIVCSRSPIATRTSRICCSTGSMKDPASIGHPIGNLLLAALTQSTGDFSQAIEQLGSMIGSRGRVFPSTIQNVRLRAELESGETVNGETRIVRNPSPIRRLSLEPSPRPVPEVLAALVNADGIVVGPGSLYTSVLPNLLVEGVAATIHGVNAVRIYVANLMTEPGETDHYTLDDHLRRDSRAHRVRSLRLHPRQSTADRRFGRAAVCVARVRACRRRAAAAECGSGAGRRVRSGGRVGWEEDPASSAVAGARDPGAGRGGTAHSHRRSSSIPDLLQYVENSLYQDLSLPGALLPQSMYVNGRQSTSYKTKNFNDLCDI